MVLIDDKIDNDRRKKAKRLIDNLKALLNDEDKSFPWLSDMSDNNVSTCNYFINGVIYILDRERRAPFLQNQGLDFYSSLAMVFKVQRVQKR